MGENANRGKWKLYLDALQKMNWGTFQFGSYNLKDWHYDKVIGFLNRLEFEMFPVDDWEITKVDGEIKHTGTITLDLYNVENYILDCHEMYIDPTLEKLFDKDCREDFRNGIVLCGSPKGGTVFDPFLGTGTTWIVCDRLERNCIGFEINQEFFDFACLRFDKSTKI